MGVGCRVKGVGPRVPGHGPGKLWSRVRQIVWDSLYVAQGYAQPLNARVQDPGDSKRDSAASLAHGHPSPACSRTRRPFEHRTHVMQPMRIPSTVGRSVCLCWAKSKPKGPKMLAARSPSVPAQCKLGLLHQTRWRRVNSCDKQPLLSLAGRLTSAHTLQRERVLY